MGGHGTWDASYAEQQFGDSVTCLGVEKSRFPTQDQWPVQYNLKMVGLGRKARKIIAFQNTLNERIHIGRKICGATRWRMVRRKGEK